MHYTTPEGLRSRKTVIIPDPEPDERLHTTTATTEEEASNSSGSDEDLKPRFEALIGRVDALIAELKEEESRSQIPDFIGGLLFVVFLFVALFWAWNHPSIGEHGVSTL